MNAESKEVPVVPSDIKGMIESPRVFTLERDVDASGISGTGRVANGVCFPNGWCVIVWCTSNTVPTLGFYANIEDVLAIHGHEGKTRLEWSDPSPLLEAHIMHESAIAKLAQDSARLDALEEMVKRGSLTVGVCICVRGILAGPTLREAADSILVSRTEASFTK